jgi:serine/threonine protein kinase
MFCRLLKDISNGLREMHETGFVHCDVKPGNVLIDEDEKGLFAVLSDFGISRVVTSTVLLVEAFKLANNDGMSVAYASPEALKRLYQEEEQASVNVEELKANDVYSYSMVTYELITQQCPWPKELSYQDVVKRVLRGERPEIPAALKQKCSNDNILNGIVEIMIQCWSENQMNRLQMKWVAEILEQLSLIVEPDNGSPTINQDTIEQHGQSLATLNQDTVCAEQQQIN